jgi:hypothetical protein
MAEVINLDGKEYAIEELSEKARGVFTALQFTTERLQELVNTQALLIRARNSYIDGIKKEMLSDKAGFLFGSD